MLHLIAIDLKQRQVRPQSLLDDDIAILNFRREKTHRFLDNCVHVLRVELRFGRPDSAQKLCDDRIEPVDFGPGNVDRFLKLRLRTVLQVVHLALHQL